MSSLRIDKEKRFDDRPRGRWWRWLLIPMLLIVAILAFFLLKQTVTPATKVKVGLVSYLQPSQSGASLVATGYVVAQRKAEVASKGTGRLVYLGFEEGDLVHKGDTIAQLDNEDIKANLELARANLRKAEVDSLDAGRNYRRQLNLYKTEGIPESTLEAAEARYHSALANVEAAVANVHAAEVDLDNTYIRAPFDGTILAKNADVGEIVAPFASSASSKGSVVTLADMSSLEVEADVSESNIDKVSVGQPCEIVLDAYPSIHYRAYVKKIVPTADRSRATVQTKVAFEHLDRRVLPEMSARVTFYASDTARNNQQAESSLTVPKEAITRRNDTTVVFRIDGHTVTEIPVTLGRELGDRTEITGPLSAGQQVVLSPPGRMTTGQKIEVSD
ncbi:MAG: efflux RND transporter periplasmic adaptor subunit [Candidatus Zixiibacteriota bacterium]|nr:MAG: efflux RND transporter periplasmic adaptor subunit [candidate division Zixibacteria bacterium]